MKSFLGDRGAYASKEKIEFFWERNLAVIFLLVKKEVLLHISSEKVMGTTFLFKTRVIKMGLQDFQN